MIDENGRITLKRSGNRAMPLEWFDDDGVELDISAWDITFYIVAGFTVIPGPNPANPKGRIIHFTNEQAGSLGTDLHEYILHYRSGPEDDDGVPLLEGYISAEGWAL